jgi:hypothetical protein
MSLELFIFILIVILSFIGFVNIYNCNNNLLLIISNLMFIIYGIVMSIIK